MGNLLKICLVVFIAATIFFAADMSYCDDNNREVKTFRGTVQEIDWVGSLITVMGMDEMTFFVPPGTKIISGTEKASLTDIELSTYVSVKYYDDPSGTPRTVSITVEGGYPDF